VGVYNHFYIKYNYRYLSVEGFKCFDHTIKIKKFCSLKPVYVETITYAHIFFKCYHLPKYKELSFFVKCTSNLMIIFLRICNDTSYICV